jgi:acyl-CoA thioester hydrolase
LDIQARKATMSTPFVTAITTRWQDCDAYGHVNNVVYYTWMDTAVTEMLYARGVLRRDCPIIGLCVASDCQFHAPVAFPGRVDARVSIVHFGTTSVRYQIVMATDAKPKPVATGHFTHVYVNRQSRRPEPLDADLRAALADLLVAPTA